jgi:hypothetical protein
MVVITVLQAFLALPTVVYPCSLFYLSTSPKFLSVAKIIVWLSLRNIPVDRMLI